MNKLRTLVVAVTLAMGLSACHLPHRLTQEQTLALIADSLYGVDYACYSEWLNGPACTVTYHILNDATAAVTSVKAGWQAVAKAVIVREESQLDADSRIRPYLDALVAVL